MSNPLPTFSPLISKLGTTILEPFILIKPQILGVFIYLFVYPFLGPFNPKSLPIFGSFISKIRALISGLFYINSSNYLSISSFGNNILYPFIANPPPIFGAFPSKIGCQLLALFYQIIYNNLRSHMVILTWSIFDDKKFDCIM